MTSSHYLPSLLVVAVTSPLRPLLCPVESNVGQNYTKKKLRPSSGNSWWTERGNTQSTGQQWRAGVKGLAAQGSDHFARRPH